MTERFSPEIIALIMSEVIIQAAVKIKGAEEIVQDLFALFSLAASVEDERASVHQIHIFTL